MTTAMPTGRRRSLPLMPFTRRVSLMPVPVSFPQIVHRVHDVSAARLAPARACASLPAQHVVGVSVMPSCLMPGNQKFAPCLQPIRMLA